MRLVVTRDADEMHELAAELIASEIRSKPDAVVVPAMGNTPMRAYRRLAEMRQEGELDTSQIRVCQLDEYLGVSDDDPRSLYGWLRRSFLDPLGIPPSRVNRFHGDACDIERECQEYDRTVEAWGGYDLVILGLGPNGHLGFNEPPSDSAAPTRAVELTEASLESNATYWGDIERVPRRALTAGMTQLLAARKILLLASGRHKREILHKTLRGQITPEVPASYLQGLTQVTVLADREAWGR